MSSTRNSSRVDSPQRRIAERFFQFQVDILWEVLLRLPIEAILCCKCVCKTWYDVTKNPIFIAKQMMISSKQSLRFICNNILRSRVRTLPSSSLQRPNSARHLLLLDFEDGKARKMSGNELFGRKIIFSHNGLLCHVGRCSVSQRTFTICNPITTESVELIRGGDVKNGDYCQVGFCFVPARQTYIVVHASIVDSKEYGKVTRFYIKSSGQRSWRMLAHPSCITNDHKIEETVYWNQAFHWRVTKGRDQWILSFDTVCETFQVIMCPDDTVNEENTILVGRLELLVLNDRLTLMERNGRVMKLWEVTGDKVGELSLVCHESYDISMRAYSLVSRDAENVNLMKSCYYVAAHGRNFQDLVVAPNVMGPYKTLQIDGLPIHFTTIPFNPSLFSPHSMGFT